MSGFQKSCMKYLHLICLADRNEELRSQGYLQCIHRYSYLMSQLQGWMPKGRDEILDQIALLHEKKDMTVILVSHSMEDIAKYVERIIVMNRGEKMYDGTPREVFAHYKELEAVGLAAPQVTYIMNALRENGILVSSEATTVEEAADEILRVVSGEKKEAGSRDGQVRR